MTAFLPPNLLALFAPRDPLPFLAPIERPAHHRTLPYTGVSQYLSEFEDPRDTPAPTRVETRDERKARKRRERLEQAEYKLEQDLALWEPQNNPATTGDPYKTLFVARINFDTSESKLRRELEVFGPIKKIVLVKNQHSTKPRGYAFVEFEHERDMHTAYKHSDGNKVDSRRIVVDVERGRTVRGWRPRRLGGGLGSTRRGPPEMNSNSSGRESRMSRDRDRGGGRDRRPDDRSRDRERERRDRERDRGGRDGRDGGRDGGRDKERMDRDKERADRDKERADRDKERAEREKARAGDRGDRDKERGGGDRRDRDRNAKRSRSRDRPVKSERKRSRSRDRGKAKAGDDNGYGEYEAEIKAEYGNY